MGGQRRRDDHDHAAAGANAVLSGLFFDPALPPPTATFLKRTRRRRATGSRPTARRATTSSAIRPAFPSYATVTPSGESTYVWAASTTDPRALQNPGGIRPDRRALVLRPPASRSNVDLTDGQTHDLELYFLDWEPAGRASRCRSATRRRGRSWTPRRSRRSTRGVSGLGGQRQRGDHDHATAGANAVLSGLFFDPAHDATRPRSSRQDTTTQGNWIGTYGTQATTSSATRPAVPPMPPSRLAAN